MLTYNYNNASPFDYACIKSRRVTRSVLGVETFSFADSCCTTILRQHHLERIPNNKMKINILNDSAKLFHLMIKNAPTKEKPLVVDIKAAKEANKDDSIDINILIQRKFNLSNAMIKSAVNKAILQTMENGTIHI